MKNNYISVAEISTLYPNGAIMKHKPYSSRRYNVTIYFYNNLLNYNECTKVLWFFDDENGYNPEIVYSKILMKERNRIQKLKESLERSALLSSMNKINGKPEVKIREQKIPQVVTHTKLW